MKSTRTILYRTLLAVALLLPTTSTALAANKAEDTSTRKERYYVNEGNKLYKNKDYQGALECYEMALMENALSDAAQYNKALAMYKMAQESGAPAKESSVHHEADSIFLNVAKSTDNALLREKAFYNAGNLAYESEEYDKSIAAYKNSLKVNPNNRKARQNLLLALNKKNENQDQQQQNQQQQQQDDKKDQQQQQEQQQQEQPQSQPQQKQELSGNSEQILKAMQAQENKTRKDNEKTENAVGYVNPKPW